MSSRARRRGARRALLAAALAVLLTMTPSHATACELSLRTHRTGAELTRLPLAASAGYPAVSIAFEHSVLGTTVTDRYEFRPEPWLVEERFDGQGYGLPYDAHPGQVLERTADGWVLTLERKVDPLVVRPLPEQNMRLVVDGEVLALSTLSRRHAIELSVEGCR